ncbi:hypothetical protein [Streptomyces sp. NPDC000618]|uniref:hypothetical protein n=1 Tax=Streptomyces sp. NPDC000618 TaxID=3154265 RepID=UPI00331B8CCB
MTVVQSASWMVAASRGSPEVEALCPGGHAYGDVGETAFGLGGDVLLVNQLFQCLGVFLGQGQVVAQPGEVAVGSGSGQRFGDPALDVCDA